MVVTVDAQSACPIAVLMTARMRGMICEIRMSDLQKKQDDKNKRESCDPLPITIRLLITTDGNTDLQKVAGLMVSEHKLNL